MWNLLLSPNVLRCAEWSRAAIRDARWRRSTVTAKPAERCPIEIVCKLMGFVVRNHKPDQHNKHLTMLTVCTNQPSVRRQFVVVPPIKNPTQQHSKLRLRAAQTTYMQSTWCAMQTHNDCAACVWLCLRRCRATYGKSVDFTLLHTLRIPALAHMSITHAATCSPARPNHASVTNVQHLNTREARVYWPNITPHLQTRQPIVRVFHCLHYVDG